MAEGDITRRVITEVILDESGYVKGAKKVVEETVAVGKATKKTSESADLMKSSMGNLTDGLLGFGGATGQAIKGMSGMVKGLKGVGIAVAATGIGALVIAAVALFTAFSKTQAGGDKLAEVFGGIGEVVDVLISRIGFLANAVVKLFTEGWDAAAAEVEKATAGIVEEMENAYEAGVALVQNANDFRDRQREINLQQAKNRKQIQDQIILTRDLTQSDEVRRAALVEANRLQSNNLKLGEEAARKQVELAQAELANVAEGLENQDQLNKLNEAQIALLNFQSGATAQRRELLNRTNELENSILAKEKAQLAELEKIRLAEQKIVEEREKGRQEQVDDFEERNAAAADELAEIQFIRDEAAAREIEGSAERAEALIEIERQRLLRTVEMEDLTAAELLVKRAQFQDAVVAINAEGNEEEIKNDQLTAAQALAIGQGIVDFAAGFAEEGSEQQRQLALLSIALSTAQGIAGAVAAGSAAGPFPANLAAIITGITAVLGGIGQARAAFATAPETSFARGGMLRGNSHSRGGIHIEAEGGEAIINKRSMSNPRLRSMASDINMAGGGVRFAARGMLVGESEATSALRSLNSGFEKSLNNNKAVLVTEDLDIVRSRVAVSEEIATL